MKTNRGIAYVLVHQWKILKRKGWITKWLSVGSLKWNFKMWSYNMLFKHFFYNLESMSHVLANAEFSKHCSWQHSFLHLAWPEINMLYFRTTKKLDPSCDHWQTPDEICKLSHSNIFILIPTQYFFHILRSLKTWLVNSLLLFQFSRFLFFLVIWMRNNDLDKK